MVEENQWWTRQRIRRHAFTSRYSGGMVPNTSTFRPPRQVRNTSFTTVNGTLACKGALFAPRVAISNTMYGAQHMMYTKRYRMLYNCPVTRRQYLTWMKKSKQTPTVINTLAIKPLEKAVTPPGFTSAQSLKSHPCSWKKLRRKVSSRNDQAETLPTLPPISWGGEGSKSTNRKKGPMGLITSMCGAELGLHDKAASAPQARICTWDCVTEP